MIWGFFSGLFWNCTVDGWDGIREYFLFEIFIGLQGYCVDCFGWFDLDEDVWVEVVEGFLGLEIFGIC